jgi:surfactin synthase thioesterase subunit
VRSALSDSDGAASAWVPPYVRRNPRALVKLFCFPYAGGGASVFLPWAGLLGSDVELWPIQLPGRENRIREPCVTTVREVADAIVRDRALHFDGRFMFFGHSLGTIIAYEVAQRLRQWGRPEPMRLIVSVHRAPQIPAPHPPTWNLPDAEFKRRLLELNGTPREVLEDDGLAEVVLPLVRADFRLDETYAHAAGYDKLSCAITAFGGARDDEIPPEHLEAWRHVTGGPFDLQMFDGDHFFIHSHRTALIDAVAQALRAR